MGCCASHEGQLESKVSDETGQVKVKSEGLVGDQRRVKVMVFAGLDEAV